MSGVTDFEKHMQETFGMTPSETRVYCKIGTEIRNELKDALRGTSVEDDRDALLLMTRLSFVQQGKLVWYFKQGLPPELAVALAAQGVLGELLDE